MERILRNCVRPKRSKKMAGGKVHFVNSEKWTTECGMEVKKTWVVYPSDMSPTTLHRVGCQKCLSVSNLKPKVNL
jgi:hypothetical protein